MKIRNKIDNSRRKTPWDDNASLTATQKFIKIKYEENYCFKHPNLLLTKEFELLNSIKIDECRRCGTKSIRKKVSLEIMFKGITVMNVSDTLNQQLILFLKSTKFQ